MGTFELLQVDVFTRTPLRGNPCAIVFDADDLDADEMLAVAREMNLSETVFLKRSASSDFRAIYYTPREEIPLAGHPTIATAHALLDTKRIAPARLPCSISLELTAGRVRVDIERDGDGTRIVMYQLEPRFLRTYDASVVMPVFGLEPADLRPGAPIETVSTGTPMLMVPVRDLSCLRRAELRVAPYLELKERGDFFSPHLFSMPGMTPGADTFARHFGVPPDTYEDPFTGSASGCMAAYLWRHGMIDGPAIVAEQGHLMGRPGRARLEVVGPRHAIETVKLIGTAVTTIRGQLLL